MSMKKVFDSVNKDLKNMPGKKSKKGITVGIAAVAGVSAVIGFVLYLQKKSNSTTMEKIKECTNSVKRTFNNVVDNVMDHIDKEKQEIVEAEEVVSYEQDNEDTLANDEQTVTDVTENVEKTADDISSK